MFNLELRTKVSACILSTVVHNGKTTNELKVKLLAIYAVET